jgi:hypothetical protein
VDIDWSNPTIQGGGIGGGIGLVGVVIAAVAGYFGAKAGARIGADAAKESARISQVEARADRDDAREAREADRQDARLDRFADRKLSLAVDVLLAADLHSDQSRVQVAAKVERWNIELEHGDDAYDGTIPPVGSTQPVREAMQALELVAPGIAEPAGDLYRATLPLGSLAARWMDLERPDASRWAEDWADALERWDDARSAFVTAVRADLGVDLGSSDA